MNYADFFTQPDGFPLESDATLGFMQTDYQTAINGLASITGGQFVILSGVEESGGQVTAGWILHQGEVMKFEAGTKSANYIISETTVSKPNQNGLSVPRYTTRVARFGAGTTQFAFDSLVRLESILGIMGRLSDVVSLEPEVIISGCQVTDNVSTLSITSGKAIIDGAFISVPAYNGAYPVYLPKDGQWTTSQPGSNYITFNPETSQRYQDILFRFSHKTGQLAQFVTLSTDWDATGLGLNGFKGFALCNGQNGTLDLRSRFLVAYDNRATDPGGNLWDGTYNTPGAAGGEKEHALSIAEMPTHNHTGNGGGAIPGGQHGLIRKSQVGEGNTAAGVDGTASGTEPDLTTTPIDIPLQGNGQAHENRPPFTVIVYAQRI